MSLSAATIAGARAAFTAAGDLVRIGQLRRSSQSTYDPITDSHSAATEITSVRMIRTSVQQQEREVSQAVVSDTKFLVLAEDIPNIDANTQDHILYDGIRYNITQAKLVPGGSVWIFFCRQS